MIAQTDLQNIPLLKRGKVRDVYELDDELLIVATDRISCFDVILPTPIPEKGKILTQISVFWFDYLKDIVPHHLITADIKDLPESLQAQSDQLEARFMLGKKCEVVPFECVVRGYLSGSGWKEYQKTGTVCGIKLPEGLQESDKLAEPLFTPATKAEEGHDENVSFEYMAEHIGQAKAQKLKDMSITLYTKAAAFAATRGIIIADTKFEFGERNGETILIDEVLTPDSSRFWPKDQYAPGRPQPSYDKQFVRDYLLTLDWNKTPPGPQLPDEVVAQTVLKYKEALHLLTEK